MRRAGRELGGSKGKKELEGGNRRREMKRNEEGEEEGIGEERKEGRRI